MISDKIEMIEGDEVHVGLKTFARSRKEQRISLDSGFKEWIIAGNQQLWIAPFLARIYGLATGVYRNEMPSRDCWAKDELGGEDDW